MYLHGVFVYLRVYLRGVFVYLRGVFVNLRRVFVYLRGVFVNLRGVFVYFRGVFENLRLVFVYFRGVFEKLRGMFMNLVVYTGGSVTKDQSWWGFTVKRGATTVREDSAVYTVSTSSLTMEREAVTHALRWIASSGGNQTTQAIILTDSMSLLQKVKKMEWGAQTRICQWSTSAFGKSCGCTALDMPE